MTDRVVPAWPSKDKTCVANVVKFLDAELKEDVCDPLRCVLPQEQWPDVPPRSRVHAADDEWYKLCAAASDIGLFSFIDESEISHDHHGNIVLNGAMGIDKVKTFEDASTQLKAHKLRISAQSDAIEQLNREQASLIGMYVHTGGR